MLPTDGRGFGKAHKNRHPQTRAQDLVVTKC